MKEQSGETEEKELIGKWIGESEVEELVLEWGWRKGKGSWLQRQGKAYRKEQPVISREDDVDGRVRVMTDEERVLRGHWTGWVLRLGNCENFVGIRCVVCHVVGRYEVPRWTGITGLHLFVATLFVSILTRRRRERLIRQPELIIVY